MNAAGLPEPPTRGNSLWRIIRSLVNTLRDLFGAAARGGLPDKEQEGRPMPKRGRGRPQSRRGAESAPPPAGKAPEPEGRDYATLGTIEVSSPELEPKAPPARFVNVELLDPETGTPTGSDCPLRAQRGYEVVVDIGPLSAASIVHDPEAFPSEHLPQSETGHWLQVGLASTNFEVPPQVADIFLPRVGAAWACDCDPGGKHTCSPEQRRDQLRLPITAPSEPGPGQFRISIYFERNVVQTLLTSADVVAEDDHEGRGRVVAVTDYTLSARLTDLDDLEPRLASVVVNETPSGTHLLVFKGSEDNTVNITFSEGQLSTAMREARSLLLDMHVDRVGTSRKNRLKRGNRKGPAELREDLTRLAIAGSGYWTALFGVAGNQLETAGEANSSVIQIARVPSSVFVFPWSMVYDLPLGSAQADFTLCPLIDEWDGEAPLVADDVSECPHAAEHRGLSNVICPFGFWGFRYAIEQPASTANQSAPRSVGAEPPSSLVIAESLKLDRGETDRHLGQMASLLPEFAQHRADSRDQVGEDLGDPELEIAYFYCHGKDGGANQKPFLEVGKADEIPPEQIVAWHRTSWREQPGHWSSTKPLVFLNGCHTAELTPQSPVNFVDCFSQVGASGVIGTEITLDQAMAGEFAEVFFGHFGGPDGLGVGDALHRTRLHFLAKGNVLGLAYTSYCRAKLSLAAALP